MTRGDARAPELPTNLRYPTGKKIWLLSWEVRLQRVAVVHKLGSVDGSLPLGYIGGMALD